MVFFNPEGKTPKAFAEELGSLGEKQGLKNVALTYLSGPEDEAVKEYQINTTPAVKNTVFVYKHKVVTEKFINFVADEKGVAKLNAAVDANIGK